MARMYAPYWKKLKEEKQVEIVCFNHSVRTIKRMIMKEKDIDLCFKIDTSETGLVWNINTSVAPCGPGKSRVSFTLRLKSTSI